MRGQVVFWDAFPLNKPTLKTDVMNPHYPDYYAKGKPPTDFQSPVPIYFLTVMNTKYQFIVGLSREQNVFEISIAGNKLQDALDFIGQTLRAALCDHGIGAKTAVGYGRME